MTTAFKLGETNLGLFRQVITPNEQCDNVTIPKEWYGRKVEVIVFPLPLDAKDGASPHRVPFRVNRHRLESMRVSSTPTMLSENLIREDRDVR